MTAKSRTSHYFGRHTLNSCHVVVKNGLLAANIPFEGYARPILFSDGALIGLIVLPANAVADVEKSRLVAGHLSNTIYSDRAHSSASTGEIVRFGR
jgi:hypothetical protein